MNTENLVYFKALAECEHYTRAAEALNIAQSTLSYAIRKMEEELGVPLFIRSGRNITLSPYGRAFYRSACRMLSEFESGKAELAQIKRQSQPGVTVGFTRQVASARFLPQIIYDFVEMKGDAAASVNAVPYVHSAQLLADLRAKKIDFGICMKTEPFGGMTATKVLRRNIFALVPSGHPLAGRDTVRLEELVHSPMLLERESPPQESSINHHLLRYCKSLNPDFTVVFASDRYNVMAQTAGGAGIGITSDASLADVFNLKAIAVVNMPWEELRLDIDFYFVHWPVSQGETAKAEFIRFVEKRYALGEGDGGGQGL